MNAIDKYTKKPIQSLREFDLYRDLEYFIRTGKHRRPAEIRWKRNRIAA